VLEFCGGGDLASYYKAPEFDKAEFSRILLEILSGLCYAHARQIAHRFVFGIGDMMGALMGALSATR
jgi:serine/threonine protein kinase